jgi:predicted O-methyltransferase YrrM
MGPKDPGILKSALRYRPNLDQALCTLFQQDRLTLPTISLPRYFDDFDREAIRIQELPRGPFSSPLSDVIMLLKVIRCTSPTKLMEVGSFRGYTALLMAQHMNKEAELVTVDMEPDHGEAYQNTPHADSIQRRVGAISRLLFKNDPPETYDFIFLDAGHFYEEVKHDTEILLPLLSETGYFVWHDYANWGYYNAKNGVPEYLHELSREYPIAHILGSDLAIYSPMWRNNQRETYMTALVSDETVGQDPWETARVR